MSTKKAYYLTEGVEDMIEVDKYLTLGHLCNVVHALASIVAHAGILIREAGEYGRYDFFKVASNLL